MSNRAFIIMIVVVAAIVGLAVLLHSPGGVRMLRAMHGG
jgi:preprotein translocase subunit SecG